MAWNLGTHRGAAQWVESANLCRFAAWAVNTEREGCRFPVFAHTGQFFINTHAQAPENRSVLPSLSLAHVDKDFANFP